MVFPYPTVSYIIVSLSGRKGTIIETRLPIKDYSRVFHIDFSTFLNDQLWPEASKLNLSSLSFAYSHGNQWIADAATYSHLCTKQLKFKFPAWKVSFAKSDTSVCTR